MNRLHPWVEYESLFDVLTHTPSAIKGSELKYNGITLRAKGSKYESCIGHALVATLHGHAVAEGHVRGVVDGEETSANQ